MPGSQVIQMELSSLVISTPAGAMMAFGGLPHLAVRTHLNVLLTSQQVVVGEQKK